MQVCRRYQEEPVRQRCDSVYHTLSLGQKLVCFEISQYIGTLLSMWENGTRWYYKDGQVEKHGWGKRRWLWTTWLCGQGTIMVNSCAWYDIKGLREEGISWVLHTDTLRHCWEWKTRLCPICQCLHKGRRVIRNKVAKAVRTGME